ncbi:UDP-2,3-diacylglucosamine diphosphatase [Amphritea sp. 1_MG-2023]|uniref:UDP-2,3-diacylglucosamine diphosphatase n=1 Tax=Amphritea sp. 1_MG-2023 TaxID=3062670 RepID=UPI0026E4588F|nr:UDP-2,3-diacylglucosamine diphosphatase [Amphritea sp. 1_MG-2023]MDO6562999.1 UDP-2,3-diacylglucosamine diphosphatase [Amphritea sp. 1_MG-2023]
MQNIHTMFISDVHLGTPDCQAQLLSKALTELAPKKLYLVGDIIDLAAMRKKAVLPQDQQLLLGQFWQMAREGCEIIYIPGNHDAPLRKVCGLKLGKLQIRRKAIHKTRDGRRFLVSHGDEFDGHVRIHPFMLRLGDHAHQLLLWLNRCYNKVRQWLNLPYRSLAAMIKQRFSSAQRYIQNFQDAACIEARRQSLDGYIGGHIHQAGFSHRQGALYCNDGDWVEHCTALVETNSGKLQLLQWPSMKVLGEPSAPLPFASERVNS